MEMSFLSFLWAGNISISLAQRLGMLWMFNRCLLMKLKTTDLLVVASFLQSKSYEPSLNQENGPDFLLCPPANLLFFQPASAGLSRLPLIIFGTFLDIDPYCAKLYMGLDVCLPSLLFWLLPLSFLVCFPHSAVFKLVNNFKAWLFTRERYHSVLSWLSGISVGLYSNLE